MVSVYLMVLTQEPSILGVSIKKFIFFLTLLVLSLILIVNRGHIVKGEVLAFILFSLLLMVVLGLYGLINGNTLSNILSFLTPIFFLAYIPVFSILFGEFGVERYLRTFIHAAVVLSLFIISVVLMVLALKLYDRQYIVQIFNGSQKNVAISFPNALLNVRVQVNSAIMIVPGILAAYYLLKKTRKSRFSIALGVMLMALVWTQSVGIWGGAFVAFGFYYILSQRFGAGAIFRFSFLAIVAIVLSLGLFRSMAPSKMDISVDAKIEQTRKGMDLFWDHPLLGMGLGYEFHNMDFRGTEDRYLEVAPVMLLSSVGMIGSLFYGFIFLYWPVRYLSARGKARAGNLLMACDIAVVIASVANPYIWSGSIGLFFPSAVAGFMTMAKTSTLT